jgi:Tat protein translocase TatC
VSFPVIAHQLWRFVAPGLYRSEKSAILPFLVASPILFTMGAAFAHYVVTPLAMNFFIGFSDAIPALANLVAGDGTFSNPDAADNELQTVFLGSVRESLDLALKFIFAFGLCFQLPVLLTLLGKAGLVTAEGLGNVRKYAVVGILSLAALVTPPDVITQLILFTVVYGLYEISIQLVRLVERSATAACARKASSTKARSSDFPHDRGRAQPDRRGAGASAPAARQGARLGRCGGLRLACRPRPAGARGARQPGGPAAPSGDRPVARHAPAEHAPVRPGLPANNALLWGARGMGKSSLVKAVHGAVAAEAPGLVLVEMQREDLPTIGRLLHLLRDAPVRVILFCDDLSFSHDDQHYKSLKAVLDGGVEGRPDNVVFYATSNRRHLMPRDMIENERSTAISPSEATEEKVSLSDRFGLWLGFHPCGQDEYLAMIDGYCAAYGVNVDPDPARGGHRMAGDARGAVGTGGVAVLHRSGRAPRGPDLADPIAQRRGLHSPCLAFGSGQAAARSVPSIRAAAAAMTREARRSISRCQSGGTVAITAMTAGSRGRVGARRRRRQFSKRRSGCRWCSECVGAFIIR